MTDENKRQKYIPWTPEHGFDLSFLTVKRIAAATGVSQYAVRDNVKKMLKLLPIEERVLVLEHMLKCRQLKHSKKIGSI